LVFCNGLGVPPGKHLIERPVILEEVWRAHPHLGPAAGPTADGFRPPSEKLAELLRGQLPTLDRQRRDQAPLSTDLPSFPTVREQLE
jgi:hypothetical protein